MHRLIVLSLVPLLACNEYDLARDQDDDTPYEEQDTQEPEPDPENPDIRIYCGTDDPDVETCDALDFGSILKGCSTDVLDLVIENVGAADLEVTEVEVSGSGADYFDFDTDPGISESDPLVLAPDETWAIGMQFTPGAIAEYTPAFKAHSNDPDAPTETLPLEGEGADYSMYEETFVQNYFESVDVLWVVDNSGSMDDEISLVKDNFASFIDEFVDLELDYQMGITTTDMDFEPQSGKLMGDPYYVTADMDSSDVISWVNQTIDEIYATTGSGTERGFDATEAALSEPLASSDNAGFFRDTSESGEEVAIASIVVTDEDDDSSSSASSFASWYNGLKTDPERATFSAICGDPSESWMDLGGCWNTNNGTSADAGTKYVDAAEATDGIWSSICTDDFSNALQHLSVTSAGMEIEFELTYTSTGVSDMTVTVDGEEVDYYSGYSGSGWKLGDNNRSVVFYGDAIPGPGDEIYVQYKYEPENCG